MGLLNNSPPLPGQSPLNKLTAPCARLEGRIECKLDPYSAGLPHDEMDLGAGADCSGPNSTTTPGQLDTRL